MNKGAGPACTSDFPLWFCQMLPSAQNNLYLRANNQTGSNGSADSYHSDLSGFQATVKVVVGVLPSESIRTADVDIFGVDLLTVIPDLRTGGVIAVVGCHCVCDEIQDTTDTP